MYIYRYIHTDAQIYTSLYRKAMYPENGNGSSKYLVVMLHYLTLPSCSFTVNALQFYLDEAGKHSPFHNTMVT